jgi:hypothetical protein
MLVDAAAVPAAGGAVVAPVKWWQVAVNSTLAVSWAPTALQLANGIILLCSTTGPFTYTATSTCEFSGETQ